MSNTTRSSLSLSAHQHDVEKVQADEKSEETKNDNISSRATENQEPSRYGALQRIVTGRSTTSYIDPGPPPDGGIEAWTVAIMSRRNP
jgi:hypothetical protein